MFDEINYDKLPKQDRDLSVHTPDEYSANQPGGFESIRRWLQVQYRHHPEAIRFDDIALIVKDHESYEYFICYNLDRVSNTILHRVI